MQRLCTNLDNILAEIGNQMHWAVQQLGNAVTEIRQWAKIKQSPVPIGKQLAKQINAFATIGARWVLLIAKAHMRRF
jgi:hypothetical protein